MKNECNFVIYIMVYILLFSNSANAALIALEYSTEIDNVLEEVTFEIKFSESPDFFTLDSGGRTVDSFQLYIDTDSSSQTPNQNTAESIIRGSEIHLNNDVRVRDRYGYDGTDLDSGGWGPILGAVSYSLVDNTVSFTTPWSILKVTDGYFTYQLLLTEYGATSDLAYGLSGQSYVPSQDILQTVAEPPSFILLMLGLLLIVSFYSKSKYNI